ncbi:Acg family FMN-binding oxidoreductase [Kribbella sp. NPDC002412]
MVELSAGDRGALLRAAVAAPSMHNTQPWRFRFHGGAVEVYRDRSRELPAEDPDRRMLFVSLGAAILNLRVEAAARGYGSRVRHLMDLRRPDLVAVVELAPVRSDRLGLLAPYVIHRRSNRGPFSAERLPAQLRAELGLSARVEGAELQWIDKPGRRWWLRLATNDAMAADDEDQARTAERRRWVGGDRAADGVPSSALGPRVAGGNAVVRELAATEADLARPVADFEPEPQLAVLVTRHDGPIEWLRAGQALERVLLEATARGVSTSLLNQAIEHEQLRRQVIDPLGPWLRPQAVIRFGYGEAVAATPRRPLDDVVVPDDRAGADGTGGPEQQDLRP